MPGPACRIHLCGQLRIAIEGDAREAQLRGRQARLLLAHLVLHRARPLTRDALSEALWVEGAPPPGESTLAPVLSRLRRAVAPATVEGRETLQLALPEPAWIDVEAARAAVHAGRQAVDPATALALVREAVTLTESELLAGLDAPWLAGPRAALADLRIEALELAAVAALTGDPAAAESSARAAVAAAPFRESARVALIDALHARGNVAEALRAYEEIRTLLRDELGTVPGAALMRRHAELLAAGDPARAAPVPRPVRRTAPDDLVERDAELQQVDAALAAAAGGAGGLVLFEGPAGIGKSALLRELGARAGDALVLEARASVLEREYGFGVARQLFEAVGPDSGLLEGAAQAAQTALADAGTGEGTFPVLNGLYQLTANLAARGPVVLCVDDVQWSDPSSLRFLAYLLRRIQTLPVLMAATLRTGEPDTDEALLAELVQDPLSVVLRPRPLTGAATAQLVRRRLGGDADAGFADACQEVTAGNPLLVRQLLAALAAEHVAPRAAEAAGVRAIGRRAVSRTVRLRLARMPADAIAVARAVAVLGDQPGLPAVAALAGTGEAQAARAVESLARTDILRAEEPLGFVHPLVRDAVYTELPAIGRGLEHARAARLLADLGASPERVAAQLLQAPPRADPWVTDRLREAADVAMRRGAPDAALTLLERAQAEPPPPEQRAALALALGGSAAYVRGPAGVEPLRRAYGELTDPTQRARAAIRLSHLLLFVSSPQEGAAVAQRALVELPAELEDLRQGLQAILAVGAAFGALDPGVLEDAFAQIRRGPRGSGPGARALTAMTALAGAVGCGPAAEATALAREAFAGDGLTAFEVTAPVALATAALSLGDPADGLAAIARYTVHARQQGEILGSIGADLWGGLAHIWAGDLRAAIASLERAQEGERLWGTKLDAVMGYSAAFMALAWLERGDLAQARTVLHRVDAGHGTSDGARFWLASQAELLLAEGDADAAVAVSQRLEATRTADTHPLWAPWRSLRARALSVRGQAAAAVALAHEDVALARRIGAPWVGGRALRILGELQGPDGLPALRQAAALLEGTSAALERAKAQAALAALASGEEGARARTQALAGARRCGADGLAARLDVAA